MQMKNLPEEEWWSAIAELQDEMAGAYPGSLQHDSADYAIDLALRCERPVRSRRFLAKNLLRDAGRTVLRRMRRFRGQDAHTDLRYTTDRRSSEPEAIAIARDLESWLRRHLSGEPHAIPCFDAMLKGEPTAHTAERLGVPDHRIEYLRSRIRQLARSGP